MDRQDLSRYACEPLAGCVYGYETIGLEQARILAVRGDRPHVVELVTRSGGTCERRAYYCLDLHQAAAKAAEMLVRMRQQRLRVRLTAIRPATADETEAFFAELELYDGFRPGAVSRCRL